MDNLKTIPLEKIAVNPVALREHNPNSAAWKELRDSIAARGVLEPIQVREKKSTDGKTDFELINGLQRFTASRAAEKKDIPAHVLNQTDAEVLETQIITNSTRVDTRPTEFAQGIKRILALNPTWTEADIAGRLQKTTAWISKQLSLNKLNDDIKKLVDDNKIPVMSAYQLARLPSEEQPAWVERAQTMESTTFAQQVLERQKQIREAHRKGTAAGPAEFVPVPRYRSRKDIVTEMQNPNIGPRLIGTTGLIKTFGKKPEDLARESFRLGVQWAMQMDPPSVEEAKSKDSARKQKETADKAAKAKERADKKAQEAAAEQARITSQPVAV